MSRKKQEKNPGTATPPPEAQAGGAGLQWEADDRPIQRQFPGPKGASALLRVAVGGEAYADIVRHAGESLDKEVCGVLAGVVCEDDKGVFVQVEAVVRGAMARQQGTQVTFTQETWNHIHDTMHEKHPKLKIVGWYHTHPGHGVVFSDMDLFIHRNFFSSPAHVALVTDPLAGTTAACINTPEGIRNLDRLWVDGREMRMQAPGTADADSPADAPEPAKLQASLRQTREKLEELETRISHLVQAVDAQRASGTRIVMVLGAIALLAFLAAAGHSIYRGVMSKYEPPQLSQYVPVPVKVGDKVVYLGIGVANWQIPDELNAAHVQAEKELMEAARAAAEKTTGGPPAAGEKPSWWRRVLIWLHIASPAKPDGAEKPKEDKSHEPAK